jgi:hypothetical protein
MDHSGHLARSTMIELETKALSNSSLEYKISSERKQAVRDLGTFILSSIYKYCSKGYGVMWVLASSTKNDRDGE